MDAGQWFAAQARIFRVRGVHQQCMCQSRKYLLSGGGSGRYVLNLSYFGEALGHVILSTAIAFFRGNQDWDETKKV